MSDRLRLLIIDDDEVDRLNVQRCLKKAGFEADEHFADNLETALKHVKSNSFNCIFLDYQLPGGDGLKILEEIKLLGIKTPVIFITSYSDPYVAARMIKSGALDYISKDKLSAEVLGHSLRVALKVSELEKQKEDVLRSLFEREKRYRELIDNSLALICIHAPDGTIGSVNPAVAQSLGYPQEYFAGKNLKEFIAPEGLRTFDLYIHNINNKKVANGLMHVLTKDGKERFWAYRNIFTEDEYANTSIIGYAQDITERIKAEKELIKAKKIAEKTAKEKEEFLANMSHEIRTPMSAIIGFTDIILKSGLTEEQRKYLSLVKTSGENLLSIINDILDFSKIEAKKMIILQKEISIKDIIYNTVELLSTNLQEKQLGIKVNIDESIPERLIGDPVRLNQILINLIGNAIKFTQKGNIEVKAEAIMAADDQVTVDISVEDTGIGIPEEKLDTIFESFAQASGDTAREYGGTGLGLTIVKKLVELMGGSISVKSEPRKGACFMFRLTFDLCKGLPTAEPVTINSIESVKLPGKLKILVAEDNIMNQILAEKVLNDLGFDPEITGNGIEAIEKIKNNKYDLVLMDIQMPHMDGLTAARKIRSELGKPAESLPIIAMTALARQGERERCLASGMNDYISKPFKPEDLLNKITEVMALTETAPKRNGSVNKATGPDHMDLTYLEQIVGGNEEMKASMMELFITEATEMLEEMELYLSHENTVDTGITAHRFRSSLTFVSDNTLREMAELLERRSEDEKNLEEMKKIYKEMRAGCDRLIIRLHSEITKLKVPQR